MFRAGSSLADKTPEEIFYQDFKKFSANGVNFGVGQISSLDKTELEELRPKIAEFMENSDRNDVDMMFFLLTNIMEESSDMVFVGENAKELVEAAFGAPAGEIIFTCPVWFPERNSLYPVCWVPSSSKAVLI